jgi:hypothetical protein
MTKETEASIEIALIEVRAELVAAMENFPPFRSAHEGVAIIDEEMQEFKEAAYWPHKFPDMAEETEATQLAAMAIRYLVDVCYKEDTPR